MSTIRVLFYTAAKDKHWLDNAISGYTGLFNPGTGKYSHCEVHWPGRKHGFDGGMCFTSTMRPPDKGTVVRGANRVIKDKARWDCCEIDVAPELLGSAKFMARNHAMRNRGYDFACILGFFLPWRVRNDNKFICSEAVQAFLFWCGIFPDLKVWSPRRLSKRLVKLGYEIKPLESRLSAKAISEDWPMEVQE